MRGLSPQEGTRPQRKYLGSSRATSAARSRFLLLFASQVAGVTKTKGRVCRAWGGLQLGKRSAGGCKGKGGEARQGEAAGARTLLARGGRALLCAHGRRALLFHGRRACTGGAARDNGGSRRVTPPARQTAGMRMGLPTTARLMWLCGRGEHTAKPQSAAPRRRFLIAELCCSPWPPRGGRIARADC